MSAANDKTFPSTKEVAESLGICRDTVERYIRAGDVTPGAVRVGEREFRLWNADAIRQVKECFNS